jgi:hypothetical protein
MTFSWINLENCLELVKIISEKVSSVSCTSWIDLRENPWADVVSSIDFNRDRGSWEEEESLLESAFVKLD